MPALAEEVILEPGSCLFVPRGTWHATRADESSVSINITLGQPTWLDLLLTALRTRLVQIEPWRELADGLNSTDNIRSAHATGRIADLLRSLQGVVDSISPDDLCRAATRDLDPQQGVQLAIRQLLHLK
jgi:ribosomal protein L16 Arg81 hydroxylase